MRIKVNDVELFVDVQGDPTPYPPIIAHHGAPGLSSHAEPKAAFGPLSDKHQVITFDARGSGDSEAKPPYTHEQWVADIDAIREHFGIDRFIMAGGSYGGFLALEYVIRYPERVTHVILRDTAARDYGHVARKNALARAKEFPQITEEILGHVFDGTMRDNDHYRQCWEAIAPLYDKNPDPVKIKERIARTKFNYVTKNFAFAHNLPKYDVREQLKDVHVPVLITVGRYDWITPVEASEELHSLLPNGELVVFENSGHSPQQEEKELWLATIRDFLQRHGAYD
jgi:proline iminopeptidase